MPPHLTWNGLLVLISFLDLIGGWQVWSLPSCLRVLSVILYDSARALFQPVKRLTSFLIAGIQIRPKMLIARLYFTHFKPG